MQPKEVVPIEFDGEKKPDCSLFSVDMDGFKCCTQEQYLLRFKHLCEHGEKVPETTVSVKMSKHLFFFFLQRYSNEPISVADFNGDSV